jgi:hypothetical protein
MKSDRLRFLRRYSLRTLFVLMTLCCLLFGAWAVYVNPYRLQQRSVAAVNRLQGTVKKAQADGSVWQAWLVTTLLGEDSYAHVVEVDLNNKNVSDKDLPELFDLIYLRKLALDRTAVTDEGVATLRSMPQLQHISLRYTQVSDNGVAHLGEMPNLQTTHLTGTKITDAGISALAGHPQMTDLYIRWTDVTSAGAERLASALPQCAIHHHALAVP